MNADHFATTRSRRVPNARRSLLRGLALFAVLATVLASEPVHALAPPTAPAPTAAKPSAAKPVSPQKPGQPKATSPVSDDAPRESATTSKTEPAARSSETSTKGSGKPASTKASTGSAKASAKAKGSAKGGKGSGQRPGQGSKSVIDEEFLIEGKLEKPNAYYILRRSSVDFDWARLGATFSPLVLESVQDPLF